MISVPLSSTSFPKTGNAVRPSAISARLSGRLQASIFLHFPDLTGKAQVQNIFQRYSNHPVDF
jgi:hypothetical protein